jgi:putative OPT family oligopeptide transporter
VLGITLAILLAGANAYLGLFAGLTVSASIPAAVISMSLLRLFRDSNILENNIVQTAASAGESVAAGAIFTLPALILLGYWDVFDYWWVSAIAGLGGLLGVLFTIPLRRSLIVDQGLAYPEGTATAEVLRTGADGGRGLGLLSLAAALGAVIKFAESGLRLWPGTAQGAISSSNGSIFYLGSNLSPALLGVGFIVGPNIGALVFGGGLISWLIAIPVYSGWFMPPTDAMDGDYVDIAFRIWNEKIRYLGVGAMLVGGIWALLSIRGSVFAGIRAGLAEVGTRSAGADRESCDQDAPMQLVLGGIVLFVLPIFALYNAVLGNWGVGLAMTMVMIVTGFLFSAVAGYMAGLVGSSNNPVSGVTIATILFASLLLLGMTGPTADAAAAAILIGAVVCCAAAIAGDNMQDLKAGHLLGATPWKQQLMQGVGVLSAALVIAPILNLLLTAYGMGPATADQPDSLAAPQATLMASVAKGVLGGQLPWGFIAAGALIGAVIVFIDEGLRRRASLFRMPVLAVAVGIYLPLELSTPIFIGGLIAFWINGSLAGGTGSGLLYAAGLITGEALIGIALAVPIAVTGNPEVLALAPESRLGSASGILAMLAVAAALIRVASTGDSPRQA